MYAGLIDDDLRLSRATYPNLELMKLSSFLKSNRDVVDLILDYRLYERYSKIYLFKNQALEDMPSLFLSKARQKTECNGFAFTNGIYVPMDNNIEKSLPDITIYDKIKVRKEKERQIKTSLKKGLIRLQTATTIPDNNRGTYLVYDKKAYQYPLFTDLACLAKLIEFTQPQEFENFNEIVNFAQMPNIMKSTAKLHYTNNFTLDNARELKGINLETPIYFNLFPEQYKNISFRTGCGIIFDYLLLESATRCRLRSRIRDRP